MKELAWLICRESPKAFPKLHHLSACLGWGSGFIEDDAPCLLMARVVPANVLPDSSRQHPL